MSLIDQTGFYHGEIVDAGLSESSGGFPQEVIALRALEVYDPDSDSYLPADPENNEITWYGVLIDSKDKETLNCKQLKKVTGWDGASFVQLGEMELIGMPIAFRVEEHTYNDNTTLQATWIDTIDASPFRTVAKLDKDGLTKLQQRYGAVLAATKAPAKPVSATPAKAPAKTTTPKTTATAPKTPAKPKAAAKPAAPKKPTVPKTVVGKCTADEAYTACYSLKRDDVTDDALNKIWLKAVAEVNTDENKITPEQWYGIKESVLKQVSKV
jgi:hypothetical protein